MKNEVVDTLDYKGYKLEIVLDTNEIDFNPRHEFDHLGVMACFHKRYSLGDKKEKHGLSDADFSGWDEMEDHIRNELDAAIVLPIYMYDHSGLTISTGPFSCPWDSGQIGFCYVTKEAVRKEYSCQRIGKKILEKVRKLLEAEVEEYDDYLTGNIHELVVRRPAVSEDEEGEEIHSCWNYIGDCRGDYLDKKNAMYGYIYSDGISAVDYDIEKENAKPKQLWLDLA